jgi:esterase/lipase
MAESPGNLDDYRITSAYDWCVKAFRTARRLLKLNIKLHDESHQPCKKTIEQGDIFLFNHFARFETFIPQYLIHAETGVYCRSIASAEFFGDERFATFLRSIGVVPNDLDGLFAFLAREILHGRKLIIFPEGGMVKDKRVMDDKGHFSIFSRTALERRKHHRGAAVIALALDSFKTALLHDYSTGQYQNVERWSEQLGFDEPEQLLTRALKPTVIVPSHITFYPIRVNDNILYQTARLFNREINRRFAEELIIEGNLLFRHTDMDIRFSTPLVMGKYWRWWEKRLLPNVVHRFQTLDELFNLTPASGHLGGRIHSIGMQAKSSKVRDDYMSAMYAALTINLSHIASYLILHCSREKIMQIDSDRFHKTLYLCIKKIQESGASLHRSLLNPEEYAPVIEGGSSRLAQFLKTAAELKLLEVSHDRYELSAKLIEEFHFDEIRTENLISVYANELMPHRKITLLIEKTFRSTDKFTQLDIARYQLDDRKLALQWDRKQYSKPRHAEINAQQTFTRDPNWYFLESKKPDAAAILLIHGFMSTPAELREFGERLHALGYHVMGVRLKGHGTSPWDLRDRNWQDWAESVKLGFDILKAFSREIHVVGFSTGGLLALIQAVSHPDPDLASVISVSAPVNFHNKNMRFVPLLHHANRMVRWVSAEGLMPFRPNDTEHPDINYAHIPIRSLYQLQKMIEHFLNNPAPIKAPVTLFQGDGDPVIVASSVDRLYQHIDADNKHIVMISTRRHGILNEDIDNTQAKIIQVISRQCDLRGYNPAISKAD